MFAASAVQSLWSNGSRQIARFFGGCGLAAVLAVCGGSVAFYLYRKHGVSLRQIARLIPFVPQPLSCQVKCYGRGQVHHSIVKNFNITDEPGAPLVLFVYKVSRETEDLRNALQWIEGKTGRKREDICAVVLLEKCLGRQNFPTEVAHQGVFDSKSVVVRILWESNKILKGSSNTKAMDEVRKKIMECQGSPTGGGHLSTDPRTRRGNLLTDPVPPHLL